MAVRRPLRTDVTALILTSGLAVTITAAGTFLTERARAADDVPLRRCEPASAFLLDDAPSPYMSTAQRRAVAEIAVTTLKRCLQEER